LKETKKHHKHALLTKPLGGEYHRQEWAIIGAPCSVIQNLANQLKDALSSKYKIGLLDAAHNAPEETSSWAMTYTDNISGHSIDFKNEWRQKNSRKYFSQLDLLLVNGNHFKGDKQIVILDERKKESLSKKLDRLTNTKALLRIKENSKDKGAIAYHGKAQREYMADVLASFCENVSISLREKQEVELSEGYEVVYDSFSGLGPFGGILSAMRQSPNSF